MSEPYLQLDSLYVEDQDTLLYVEAGQGVTPGYAELGVIEAEQLHQWLGEWLKSRELAKGHVPLGESSSNLASRKDSGS